MPVVKKIVTVDADIETVWKTMTCLGDQNWRRDIERVEVLGPREFIEHTKDGYATKFTVTALERPTRYEFDMDSTTISGHWSGMLRPKGSTTELELVEDVTPKKWFMRPLGATYLKCQMANFVDDLHSRLHAQ